MQKRIGVAAHISLEELEQRYRLWLDAKRKSAHSTLPQNLYSFGTYIVVDEQLEPGEPQQIDFEVV